MATKIAIIGGGSAYAPGLLKAFIDNATAFTGTELVLMDIAAEELSIVHRLGSRMIESAEVNLSLSATTNQREAITNADYVLTTFRQGGFEARHQDESIPLQFDIIGQETIGPGGFFFAMRTLPVIKTLVEDIKQYALPNAVLVNYTNPTQIVAEAVTHFTDIPCISICDQTNDDLAKILHALNIQPQSTIIESIGLNHATWSTTFSIDGQDGVDLMLRHCDDVLARDDVSDRVKRQFRLTREYGRVPNSYLQYYYYRAETVAEAKSKSQTRAQRILEMLPGYYAHFREQAAAAVPHVTHVRGGSIFGDMAVDVLRGLVNKAPTIHILNVPNRGAIPGFDRNRVVEVPARLEADGATPLVQNPLPHEFMGLLHMLAEYQWLAADAIWNGDTKAVKQALASNPLVMSLSVAEQLLDAIVPLQKDYFPKELL